MSLPCVYEGISSPPGMRLMYVGTSAEHDNRRGTTHEQYFDLAGQPATVLPPERVLQQRTFILEDVERPPVKGVRSTVVGGAVMALATAGGGGDATELHVTSCYVRKECRSNHLGSYIVSKLLEEYLLVSGPTRLYAHTTSDTPQVTHDILAAKGFTAVQDNPSAYMLRLPGFVPGYTASYGGTMAGAPDRQNGLFGKQLYRHGKHIATIQPVKDPADDWSMSRNYSIRGSDGQELARLEPDNPDINWRLTAAIYALNIWQSAAR